jgi:hypothetical protein
LPDGRQGARISFATPQLMFRIMTANRWDIIGVMAGAGPMALRELARRLDRGVKSVHGDAQAFERRCPAERRKRQACLSVGCRARRFCRQRCLAQFRGFDLRVENLCALSA